MPTPIKTEIDGVDEKFEPEVDFYSLPIDINSFDELPDLGWEGASLPTHASFSMEESLSEWTSLWGHTETQSEASSLLSDLYFSYFTTCSLL